MLFRMYKPLHNQVLLQSKFLEPLELSVPNSLISIHRENAMIRIFWAQ